MFKFPKEKKPEAKPKESSRELIESYLSIFRKKDLLHKYLEEINFSNPSEMKRLERYMRQLHEIREKLKKKGLSKVREEIKKYREEIAKSYERNHRKLILPEFEKKEKELEILNNLLEELFGT